MKCDCDGFTDAWTYSGGHYTIQVHEPECPNNPDNWTLPETDFIDLEEA